MWKTVDYVNDTNIIVKNSLIRYNTFYLNRKTFYKVAICKVMAGVLLEKKIKLIKKDLFVFKQSFKNAVEDENISHGRLFVPLFLYFYHT